MRAYIAQKVDVIVIFADAGAALLPTVKEATAAGILVVLHNGTDVGGKPGKDYVSNIAENICSLGADFVKVVADNSKKNPTTHRGIRRHAGQRRSAPAWQKCCRDGDHQAREPEAARQGRHQLDAGRHVRGDVRFPVAGRQRRLCRL